MVWNYYVETSLDTLETSTRVLTKVLLSTRSLSTRVANYSDSAALRHNL